MQRDPCDETMYCRTYDCLITLNDGLGTLKTKSRGGFKGRGEGWVGVGLRVVILSGVVLAHFQKVVKIVMWLISHDFAT